MMNACMASRPALTLYDGLLQAMRRYGDSKPCMTDMTLKTDNYHVLLKKSLGVSRILQRLAAPGEHVGLLLPNATLTAAAVIGALIRGRVPAMLNYTAGVGTLNHAVDAAGLKIIVSSRQFLDKARLTVFLRR